MDGMLSQDEINALLNGMSADDSADNETSETPQESNESASDNTPNTDNQRPFLILRKMQLARYLI